MATAHEQRWLEIGKAVERACGELPDGYEVHLELQRDAGTVCLYLPDAASIDQFHGDAFVDDINAAIDEAAALARKEG